MRKFIWGAVLALTMAAPASAQMPNLLGDLQAERAKYPATISAAQAGELLNAVAWKHRLEGFGLLRKDSGNRCPVPGSAATVACDWLVHRPSGRGCDVLTSGPDSDPPANGPAGPTWCAGDPFDTSRFLEPVEPPGGGGGGGGGGGTDTLEARLAALEARVAKLEAGAGGGGGGGTPASGDLVAIAKEQLETTKQILELLKKTASRFGVQ